jgi:hypothetical protein
MTVLYLLVATALPWILGLQIALLLFGERAGIVKLAGHGYALGVVYSVVAVYSLDLLGIALQFKTVALAFLAGIAVLALPSYLKLKARTGESLRHNPSEREEQAPIAYAIVATLLCVIVLQIAIIGNELFLRPTFPWDAWRGWEPKTLQFYDSQALAAPVETIGNYGLVSPIAHLWFMLPQGVGKHPASHTPWLLAYIAIGVATYGQLRVRFSVGRGVLGAFAVTSLPYLTIHGALAGYADLLLTLFFTLSVFSLSDYAAERRASLLGATFAYALACIACKRAGLGMGAIVMLCAISIHFQWRKKTLWVLSGACLGLVVATVGMITLFDTRGSLDVPMLGTFALSNEQLRLGNLGRLALNYRADLSPFFESLFVYANWHLAALFLFVALLPGAHTRELAPGANATLAAISLALVYLVLYFTLVSPGSAHDHSGLTRAILCLMPAAIVLAFQVLPSRRRNSEPRELATKCS